MCHLFPPIFLNVKLTWINPLFQNLVVMEKLECESFIDEVVLHLLNKSKLTTSIYRFVKRRFNATLVILIYLLRINEPLLWMFCLCRPASMSSAPSEPVLIGSNTETCTHFFAFHTPLVCEQPVSMFVWEKTHQSITGGKGIYFCNKI